jgi:glyoxylase-like metal-dependent hydrolase (beta-lactamase superfamily II)
VPGVTDEQPEATASSPPREIAPGIWWITECLVMPLGGSVKHLHVAPYLIVGSDAVLLYDTGTPSQWKNLQLRLDAILGDRPIDYIIPSHPEIAHCGNAIRMLEKYPSARLLGDIRDYANYFPDHVDRFGSLAAGEVLDLGSHRFEFVDALIKDLPNTQWGYEQATGTLFVADGFAYSHQPPIEGDDRPTHLEGECNLLASELGAPPSDEQVIFITKAALYWTHFVKLSQFLSQFKDLLRQYPPTIVAPAHGAVIDDVDNILWLIWDSLEKAYDPARGLASASVDVHDADDSKKGSGSAESVGTGSAAW